MIDFSTPTLTKEELLHYVTEEQVFRHYFGDFQLKRTYSSPFRIDRDPSFGFYYGTFGELKCNDIVKQEKLDFIAFVAKKYGISYSEAIRKITEDFNIFCTEESGKKVLNAAKIQKQSSLFSDKFKKKTKIQIVPAPFTKNDLDYWAQWSITEEELKKEAVFAYSQLFINGEPIPTKEEIKFAYYQKDEDTETGYFKIYQPFSKNHKWLSNIPLSLPFNIDKLSYTSDNLIISKSKKDLLVLKKLFPDVLATQNESQFAVQRCVEKSKKFKKTTVIWDSDDPGRDACIQVTNENHWNYFNTPRYLYEEKGIKDVAEYVFHFGLSSLEKRLKEKRIL